MGRVLETMECLVAEGVYYSVRIACWNPLIARLLDQPVTW